MDNAIENTTLDLVRRSADAAWNVYTQRRDAAECRYGSDTEFWPNDAVRHIAASYDAWLAKLVIVKLERLRIEG